MGRIPEFLTFLSVALLGSCFCISFSQSVLVIPDFFIPFCEKLDRSWTAGPGPGSLVLVSSSFSLQVTRLTVVIYHLKKLRLRCEKPGCKVNRTEDFLDRSGGKFPGPTEHLKYSKREFFSISLKPSLIPVSGLRGKSFFR